MSGDAFLDPENVALLRKTAPAFFGMIEESLIHDVVVSVCRLLDAPDSGKNKDNLTFKHLAKAFGDPNQDAFRASFDAELAKLEAKADSLLIWRHKKISHNGLNEATKQSKLPKLVFSDIDDCFLGMMVLLNMVNDTKLQRRYRSYDEIVIPQGVEHLVRHLEDWWKELGARAERLSKP